MSISLIITMSNGEVIESPMVEDTDPEAASFDGMSIEEAYDITTRTFNNSDMFMRVDVKGQSERVINTVQVISVTVKMAERADIAAVRASEDVRPSFADDFLPGIV